MFSYSLELGYVKPLITAINPKERSKGEQVTTQTIEVVGFDCTAVCAIAMQLQQLVDASVPSANVDISTLLLWAPYSR
jgi:hypothetical protein